MLGTNSCSTLPAPAPVPVPVQGPSSVQPSTLNSTLVPMYNTVLPMEFTYRERGLLTVDFDIPHEATKPRARTKSRTQ